MDLGHQLSRLLPRERVLTRLLDRVAFANDASVYRRVPKAVVLPRDVEEIRRLLRFSRERRVPLTFRAAGTSLSGQAVTDGILAVLSRHWRGLHVEEGGQRVRVEPGVIGGVVNQHLRRHGTKLGPDPASINSCMIGGILANNSSGMCCGVRHNAYHTLESMRFVLPCGIVVDSALPDAEERLGREAPELVRRLLDVKRRVESSAALRDRIRAKYRMKNTMGYSLNALLDYASPVQILAHLMIGSEGTLGFIAEATLRTIPELPCKSTGLLVFDDVPAACDSIAALRESGAETLELLDRASLRAIQGRPGVPTDLRSLPATAAALLVEYQCASPEALENRRAACRTTLPRLSLAREPDFTEDSRRQAELWTVRKGLIPSVGAMRRRGTSFIIEDVVFPLERLAPGVMDLQGLLGEHGYDDAILFGHAKDGNLHFVLTQAFDRAAEVRRYDRFMVALAELVATRHGGALKAEHGTGRNMAPFVLTEWGPEAYTVMRDLKSLLDPEGLLNPGVVINDDPAAHIKDLKALPEIEPEVDRCIECGFCERSCPSRDLTLTPRQRIVVRREMARLRQLGDHDRLRELERDFRYAGLETCAADGLCSLACPVSIDTGQWVKRLRARATPEPMHELATVLAERFWLVEGGVRVALRLGAGFERLLGGERWSELCRGLSSLSGRRLPTWRNGLRDAGWSPPLAAASEHSRRAVYFPSCVSRVVAEPGDHDAESLPQVVRRVTARHGIPLWIPSDVRGHCCGLAFASKGYDRAAARALEHTARALLTWSRDGALPVMVDSSPCALTLKEAGRSLSGAIRARYQSLTVLDGIELADRDLRPRLEGRRQRPKVVLHPVCSVRKMGLVEALERVSEAAATAVEIPIAAGCCGAAGDRGLRLPELPAAAVRDEASELASSTAPGGYYSSSRTCELALTEVTGRPYRSFWHLLDELDSPERPAGPDDLPGRLSPSRAT